MKAGPAAGLRRTWLRAIDLVQARLDRTPDGTPGSDGPDGPDPRRSWPQRLLIAFNVLFVVGLLFAAVRLNSAVEQSTLLVPSEAVIRTGKRALVMLAEGDGRYRPQEITLGREADGRLEVLSGLEEGQAVVTSGQFLIDSEASLQGILAGNAEQDSTEGLHVSHGVIRALDGKQVTLEHGPFESLNMPGMTMAFPLVSSEVAVGLKPGDHVRIAARQTNSGLLIEQLRKEGDQP